MTVGDLPPHDPEELLLKPAGDGTPLTLSHRDPITRRLQEEFFGIVRGEIPDRHGWLVPVS